MSAISVRQLGKQFRLGLTMHNTLRDQLAGLFRPRKEEPNETFWALKDVSFDLAEGEVVGIIGRNGAGKSTLLKVLSQITDPTEGEVRIRGRVASLLEVGTGFHPELSGRENVFLNGAILGMSRREIRAKFDEIVAFAEVEKFIDTPVKHYSSGMYVRLAFAVAAHLDPEILIVDEVLAVGDAAFQRKCLGKMEEVGKGGRTVLFVSHNMAAVENLCTRGILLEKGRLVLSGKVDEVISAYARENSSRVATFSAESEASRVGNGRVRFTGIRIQGADETDRSVVHTGEDIVLKLYYRSQSPRYQAVVLYCGIYDHYDTLLLGFSNEVTCGPFSELPEDGEIICRIPNIPLTPGVYTLAINCQVNGETADIVYSAAKLNVEGGDFYGTGRVFPNPRLRVLTAHSWELRSAGVEAKPPLHPVEF